MLPIVSISFALYTNIPETELEDSAPQIFDILLEGCEEALRMAIDAGKLSAHEARSEFRHRMILDELAAIQKNLEFLTEHRQLDIKAILQFEKQYRAQVAQRHSRITPPYLNDVKKLAIDRLYVAPNFIALQNQREEHLEKLELEQFRGTIYRSVLLGNPGAGKSTFSQKLCYDLARNSSQVLLFGKQFTPILVILREYGAAKKERNCSILQFIEENANARYQVKPPDSAFEYLLLNGHTMVIFDGLDELTDTSKAKTRSHTLWYARRN